VPVCRRHWISSAVSPSSPLDFVPHWIAFFTALPSPPSNILLKPTPSRLTAATRLHLYPYKSTRFFFLRSTPFNNPTEMSFLHPPHFIHPIKQLHQNRASRSILRSSLSSSLKSNECCYLDHPTASSAGISLVPTGPHTQWPAHAPPAPNSSTPRSSPIQPFLSHLSLPLLSCRPLSHPPNPTAGEARAR
jgi:hypothetical protein